MGGLLCSPSADHSVYINGRKYFKSHTLGEGGFSIVYLVKDSSGRKYALKRMICQTDESLEIAHKEINTIRRFHENDNIIKLIDHATLDSHKLAGAKEVLMLMTYYREGSLQDILDKQRITYGKDCTRGVFNEREVLRMFKQICLAIQCLHRAQPMPLAHRDIKPGNILISDTKDCILTDFGSVCEGRVIISSRQEALSLQDHIESTTTPFYRAPELFDIQSNAVIDERTDVWALGCLLYAMAYNKSPFEVSDDERSTSVQLSVLNGLPKQFPNSDYSERFMDLIRSMVHLVNSQRPFIKQVIEQIDSILN